jgi:exosome complex component RRP41
MVAGQAEKSRSHSWYSPSTTCTHALLILFPQASRVEILNEGGYRSDGRRCFELRTIAIDLSQQGHADGAVSIIHGLTHVLVSVFGPREAKMRSQTIHDRANINVEVSVAAFSTGDRRKRSRGDK